MSIEAEAARELELLDRVLLKFVSANDSELSTSLEKFLVPCLVKLSSPHQLVHKKVTEIITHVSKRFKSDTSVRLPLSDLTSLLVDSQSPPLVKSFTLILLDLGYSRATPEVYATLIPRLLSALSCVNATQRDSIMHLIVQKLHHATMPSEKEEALALYTFTRNESSLTYFLDYIADFLLYTPITGQVTLEALPAGMSMEKYNRIVGKKGAVFEDLNAAKLACLGFLSSHLFGPNQVVYHFLVASGLNHHSIVSRGEDLLKRASDVDYEDEKLVKRFYQLYLGDSVPLSTISAEQQRRPAALGQKIRILAQLLKSRAATQMLSLAILVIRDSFFGQDANSRIRYQGVRFAIWVVMQAQMEPIRSVSKILLALSLKLLEVVTPEADSRDMFSFRGQIYLLVGHLCSRAPELVAADISILRKFFLALEQEDANVRVSIQEAISYLCEAFKLHVSIHRNEVESLLLEFVDHKNYSVRFSMVSAAKKLLPPESPVRSIICLLLMDDERHDIKDEAQKGLDLDLYPDFNIFSITMHKILCDRKARVFTEDAISNQAHLPVSSIIYSSILQFALKGLRMTASAKGISTAEYLTQLSGVAEGLEDNGFSCYVRLLEDGLLPTLSSSVHLSAMSGFLCLISQVPSWLADKYARQHQTYLRFLSHHQSDIREITAHFYGFLVGHMGDEDASAFLSSLGDGIDPCDLDKTSPEVLHGHLLAIGFVIAKIYQDKRFHLDVSQQLAMLFKATFHSSAIVNLAAAQAFGVLGRYGNLPQEQVNVPSSNPWAALKVPSRNDVMQKLLALFEGKDHKTIETAVVSLSNLCLGDNDPATRRTTLQWLFKLSNHKQVEVEFTVGEAIVVIGAGLSASCVPEYFQPIEDVTLHKAQFIRKVTSTQEPSEDDTLIMDFIINNILEQYIRNVKAEVRNSGVIWLLCLVQYAQNQPIVGLRLMDIQKAFTDVLMTGSEFIQEVAAKGLSICYALTGDEKLKADLVSSLVGAITGDRKKARPLDEDTELFQDGALGKTPDGSSITTYKEICSMVNDIGKPELIYKFLDLSNHNQMWNTRKGAAFGISSVASIAGGLFEKYLPSIIPRLYRFQYDPNPNVRESMKGIWASLVSDPKVIVTQHYAGIMEELIRGIGDRVWRTREASCMGLADILLGRKFEEVEPYLPQLWQMTYRAMDDVKETVRKAGQTAARAVASFSLRVCNPTLSPERDAKKAIDVVLPFIVHQGITSAVDEIRSFSLGQLIKLTEAAGFLVKPHLADLITALLEALSSNEPQEFNYMQFHVAKIDMTQEELENARIAVCRATPLSQAIDRCLNYADADIMVELAPKLANVMKTGVGLPTRSGCASVVSRLCSTQTEAMKTQSAILLRGLGLAIGNERSVAVRKLWVNAASMVCRYGKQKPVVDYFARLRAIYNKSVDDKESRLVIAYALRNLSQNSLDSLKNYGPEIMPFVFLSKYDEDEQVRGLFHDVWQEVNPSSSGGVSLYAKEILELIKENLDSSSWILKKHAAHSYKSISTMDVPSSIRKQYITIFPQIIATLPGRIWDGKQLLVEALGNWCESSVDEVSALSEQGEVPDLKSLTALLMQEVKRTNPIYRKEVIDSLGKLLRVCENEISHKQVIDLLRDIARPQEDVSEKSDEFSFVNREQVRFSAFQTIALSWSTSPTFPQDSLGSYCENLLGTLGFYASSLSKETWNGKVVVLKSTGKILDRIGRSNENITKATLDAVSVGLLQDAFKRILSVIDQSHTDRKFSQVGSICISKKPRWNPY
eukprot:TRINITY_DN5582_c0_g1_i1.p1 TRINITY_DN5582_c0_g1~~TRINITY_DN5582_c0_g1_i1.p1  ORF type:complete len:1767 (+),score=261.55 TRINITY_DN5582_c0_g1_i1:43-5343(+)